MNQRRQNRGQTFPMGQAAIEAKADDCHSTSDLDILTPILKVCDWSELIPTPLTSRGAGSSMSPRKATRANDLDPPRGHGARAACGPCLAKNRATKF
jgi:hypothetical protein